MQWAEAKQSAAAEAMCRRSAAHVPEELEVSAIMVCYAYHKH